MALPSPFADDGWARRAEAANLPLVGGEEWLPEATKSQLLGFSNDERPAGQGQRIPRCPRQCRRAEGATKRGRATL